MRRGLGNASAAPRSKEMPTLSKAGEEMSQPLICCICPVKENSEFLRRAARCFERQTVDAQIELTIGDNSWAPMPYVGGHTSRPFISHRLLTPGQSVGALRNDTIALGASSAFIAHFDYDDISASDRLSIQLAHMRETGKLVTGFYNMLFYDSVNDKVAFYEHEDHRYALGTSLFYRREAWERHKFPNETPEDNKWRNAVGLDNCSSISSLREDGTPIMIQTIHGANGSARIVPGSPRWKTPTAEQEREVRRILASA